MHRIAIALAMLGPFAVGAQAPEPKSADECAAEIGNIYGQEREHRMVACLLSHNTPDAPAGASDPAKGPAFTYIVSAFGLYDVNSAGGVEPYARVVNPNKNSAIKYLRLQVTMYNAVGDVVRSTIGGQSTNWIRFTGPLTHEDGEEKATWGPVFYNHSAACLKLQAVSVEFMNGKKQTFTGAALKSALASDVQNDCRARVR